MTQEPKEMDPQKIGLLKLIEQTVGSQFVIPIYQRNYTWTDKKEVKQYLDDLASVLSEDYKNHFLGIFIYRQSSSNATEREFSIVDGQQRLTTTFLILYAIRYFMKGSNDDDNEEVKNLDNKYLLNTKDNIKYKLKPLVSDDIVYKCIVEGREDEIMDTDSNVLKNYQFIKKYLDKLFKNGYDANEILNALDKLYVVCVPLTEKDDVQKIFESINATGEKLTAADLIRNYLLMDLTSELQDDYYEKYWIKLEENVSSDPKKLEFFFRMYLEIKKGIVVSKNNVYREFVNWRREEKLLIQDVFEDLLKYAKIFYELLNKNLEEIEASIKPAVDDFRKMQYDVATPLMMEFYALYWQKLITLSTLNRLFWSVNTYIIRRSLCDLNSRNISKLFPSVLKRVKDQCKGKYDDILEILNQKLIGDTIDTIGSYMPTDKQMMESLYNANVYKRKALKVVLDRLELHENPAEVNLTNVNIEHLMPQTPTKEWLEELDTDVTTYFENLHRIGNLTLATRPDNSKMSNSVWEYKNEVLKETGHLTLNMEILSIRKWNLKKIDERTKNLIKRICGIYPYPDIQ